MTKRNSFSSDTPAFCCQYRPINATCTFIPLSSTLYDLKIGQRP